MVGKSNILEYRSKLDRTLASPELMNDEMVHTIVKHQMLQSFKDYTEYVVERRTEEVWNFLSMLRSASAHNVDKSKSSEDPRDGWKVKQDTEEFRIMYREGPEGTPFHTLLVEGYVDGPVDVCLCISCVSDLYKQWWPQTAIPAFKVLSSHRVKKIRAGEQIALVRMKVPWPLSSREALVHYFTFEYFQDGLVVVLLNTISDVETVDRSTHGFTRDGIPDAEDVVRIDVVGGFAVQKVGPDRSYFRTIANMDIKLDFVPPAFINFVARQLIGSGFRLYKKEVGSVSKGDEKFFEALKDPHYDHIRQALYAQDTSTASPPIENSQSKSVIVEKQSIEAADGDSSDEKNESNGHVIDSQAKFGDATVLNEIEEFKENDTVVIQSFDKRVQKSPNELANEIEEIGADDEVFVITEVEEAPSPRATDGATNHFGSEVSSKGDISPVVREALGTLEKVISILREYNNKPGNFVPDVEEGDVIHIEDSEKEPILSKADQIKQENRTRGELAKAGSAELTSVEPENTSESHSSRGEDSKSAEMGTNQRKVVPASPNDNLSNQAHIQHMNTHTSLNRSIASSVPEHTSKSNSGRADANTTTQKKKKTLSLCCLTA